MDKLVVPMSDETLREYELELAKEWWSDVTEDKYKMLHNVKDHTCDTDGSPIKMYLAVRWVSANQTALLIDGVLLDTFSASAIYQVAQYLMKENKKDLFLKIFSKNITTIATHCLKCLK